MQGLGAGADLAVRQRRAAAHWLPRTRAGNAIAAFALTEPRSGSDVANIATTARRDGDGYVLDGEKTWISNGGIADLYVVFARTGEAPGAKGLSRVHRSRRHTRPDDRRAPRVDRAASAGPAALRGVPRAGDPR